MRWDPAAPTKSKTTNTTAVATQQENFHLDTVSIGTHWSNSDLCSCATKATCRPRGAPVKVELGLSF